MSRCFPFPPPGYERKVRIDDIDLLAKEKHKEKKHKKDKKDKEKRDKKDKDRSKERKDQKEKHKDKKERDGANGSTRTSEEKRIEGKPESYNGQKHGPNSLHNVDIKDFKYVQELDRRCRNDDGATGSQAVQKIMATDQRPLLSNHSREKGRTKDKKEDDRTFNAQRNLVEGKCSSDAFVQNSPSIDQRRLEGSAKSIEKDGEKQIKGRDQKENTYYDSKGHKPKDREKEKKVKSKDKDRDKKKEKKEKMKEISKPYEHPKLKGSGKDSLDACSNKALDPLQMNSKNFAAGGNLGKLKELEINGFLHGEKEKVKEISKPFEQPKLKGSGKDSLDACSNKALDPLQMNSKNFGAGGSLGKRKELEMNGFLHGEKEKVKEISKTSNEQPKLKGSGKDSLDAGSNKALGPLQMNSKNFADGGNLGKRKELEMNGYLHGEKEKVKEISKPSNEQPKQKASGKDSLDACSNKALDFPQMNSKNSAAGVNLGKRKELEMNGYLHENGFLPHKLPRPVSSHPVMENGRKSEPCQTVLQFVSEGQGAASNCKAEIKELRINGLKGSEQPNGCSTRPSSSTVKVNENGEASAKPPHPDSKYLSEILSIPEMGDGSDFDDQEWLFSSDGLGSKKPKAGAPGVETPPQVWAEAMHIESVDVFALPYVIPY